MSSRSVSRRQGAVRSEAARIAILQATAERFAAIGYDQLTIEGIAAHAGVAKQTIYRWWPSKSAVVAETLLEGMLLPGHFQVPDTGNIREDLATWVTTLQHYVISSDNNALVCSLLAAAAENENVGKILNDALGATWGIYSRIDSAVAAGEFSLEITSQELVEALIGAVVVRALRRVTTTQNPADSLVRALVHSRQTCDDVAVT